MFKKGTYNFNDDENFNFQLNRVIMWGNGNPSEIKEVSKEIHNSTTWVKTLTKLADKAKMNKEQMQKSVTYECQNFSCMILIQ